MFYVYGLLDSSTEKCFYVGKGCNSRMYAHVQKVKCGSSTQNPHLDRRIAKLLRENVEIAYVKFCDNLLEDEAFEQEDLTIRALGIETLCNVWYGGKGGRVPTDEIRRKISEKCKGRILSIEHKHKLRLARLGTHQTPETKAKKSVALKGKPQSFAQRAANEKRRQALAGKPKTEEHKLKLSQARLNNPVRFWQGKHLSVEHRTRISETLKAYDDQPNG